MNLLKSFVLTVLVTVALASPFLGSAADAPKKPRPYLLKTCIVSGDKLGGDMGAPYVLIYGATKTDPGREIKFCCKSCLPDFNKEPAKYLKKIDEAEAKLAKDKAATDKPKP
jgi:hypothetical protein